MTDEQIEQALEAFSQRINDEIQASGAAVNAAKTDAELDAGLLEMVAAYRKRAAFEAEAEGAGASVRRHRWDLQDRLTAYQQRRLLGLKHGGSLPRMAVDTPWRHLLEKLREANHRAA